MLGEGDLHLSEHGTRLHSSFFRAFGVDVGERVQLGFPSGLQFGDVGLTLTLVGKASDAVLFLEALQHLGGRLLAVTMHESVNLLGKS